MAIHWFGGNFSLGVGFRVYSVGCFTVSVAPKHRTFKCVVMLHFL